MDIYLKLLQGVHRSNAPVKVSDHDDCDIHCMMLYTNAAYELVSPLHFKI